MPKNVGVVQVRVVVGQRVSSENEVCVCVCVFLASSGLSDSSSEDT